MIAEPLEVEELRVAEERVAEIHEELRASVVLSHGPEGAQACWRDDRLVQARRQWIAAIEVAQEQLLGEPAATVLALQRAELLLEVDEPRAAACQVRELSERTDSDRSERMLHDANYVLGMASVLVTTTEEEPSDCVLDAEAHIGGGEVDLERRGLWLGAAHAAVELGRYEEAIDHYSSLVEASTEHRDLPLWYIEIAKLWTSIEVPDPVASHQAERAMLERCGPGTTWWEHHQPTLSWDDERLYVMARSMANEAKVRHIEAQESGNPEVFARAAELYQHHLDAFPEDPDHDQLRWYMADALFNSKQFERTVAEFERILEAPESAFRDGALFRRMQALRQILVVRYGKVEAPAEDAPVAETRVSAAGVEIEVYALSDAHRAFIEAADAMVDTEFRDPTYIGAREDNLPALRYLPGQILYEHGWYPEARDRFELVIEHHLGRQEAEFAASLILMTYQEERDLDSLAEWLDQAREAFPGEFGGGGWSAEPWSPWDEVRLEVDRLGGKLDCGHLGRLVDVILGVTQPEPRGDGGAQLEPELLPLPAGEWCELQEGTLFKLAADKSGVDHLEAAYMFLRFLNLYPDSEFLRDAHFNAADNLEKAGCVNSALRLFGAFVERYPSDERSEGLIFRLAHYRAARLDYQGAIDRYQLLLDHFPDSINASAAHYNLAFQYLGLERRADAARGFEAYATRWPTHEDAEFAFWLAADGWAAVGPREGLAAYQRYLARYRGTSPHRSIMAQHAIWQLQIELGHERQADRARHDLLVLWDDLEANEPEWYAESRHAAGQAALVDLRAQLDSFLDFELTGDEETDAHAIMEGKVPEVHAFGEQSLSVMATYRDFETASWALTLHAEAWYALVGWIEEALVPFGPFSTPPDPLAELEGHARSLAEAALEHARKEQRWTTGQDHAFELLHGRYPEEYPRTHVERTMAWRLRPPLVEMPGAVVLGD